MGEVELCKKGGHWKKQNKLLKEANEILAFNSLEPWEYFLQNMQGVSYLLLEYVYSIYTFEPLHNFYLALSKFVKTCFMSYFSSHFLSHPSSTENKKKKLLSMRKRIQSASNSIFAAIQKDSTLQGLHIYF